MIPNDKTHGLSVEPNTKYFSVANSGTNKFKVVSTFGKSQNIRCGLQQTHLLLEVIKRLRFDLQ